MLIRPSSSLCSAGFAALFLLAGGCTSQPVPVASGTLRVVVNTNNEIDYALQEEDGRYVRLDLEQMSSTASETASIDWRTAGGSRVEVFGKIEPDGSIAVTALRLPASTGVEATQSALVTRNAVRILVLRVTFDGGSAMGTAADATSLMDSAVKFWTEASFGQLQAAYDLAGPYDIRFNQCSDNWRWMSDATTAAKNAGIDTTRYQHFMMLGNQSCGYGGLGEQPGVNSWVAGLWPGVVVHELGHNFGLWHASSRTCTSSGATVTMSDSCTYAEYGDPFDPMGDGWPHHYSATNKSFLGWIAPDNIKTALGDMTYTLAPSTLPSNGLQLIHVKGPQDIMYQLDFRRSASFDTYAANDPVVNGVSVRALFTAASDADRAHLLDLSPDGNFSKSALGVGQSYTFYGTSTTLTVLSAGASGASIQITGAGAAPIGERLAIVSSGKCLALNAGSGDAGTTVVQRVCNGGADQLWTLTDSGAGDGSYNVRNATGSRCLDVLNASSADGAAMIVWDCNGGNNQKWKLVASGSSYSLRPLHSGKCATLSGASTGDGAPVVQSACTSGTNQLFNRGGGEHLVAAHSSKCIGVKDASAADSAPAVQQACDGTSTQQWALENLGNDAYDVRNMLSGKCLDVLGAGTTNGATVGQYTCSGNTNQQWKLTASASGYALQAVHSGLCLDVFGASTADAAQLVQWTCNGQTNQQFARK
jgi:hypothetical protein